jgi:hypothetical protein
MDGKTAKFKLHCLWMPNQWAEVFLIFPENLHMVLHTLILYHQHSFQQFILVSDFKKEFHFWLWLYRHLYYVHHVQFVIQCQVFQLYLITSLPTHFRPISENNTQE